MGTGVVSLDLASVGWDAGSDALAVVTGAVWLAVLLTGELPRHLAGVSATAVLGTRLTGFGWTGAAWALLAGSAALWAWRVPRVRITPPTRGADLLVVVVTQSLTVLAARLMSSRAPGCALLAGGVVLYAGIVVRFDLRQLTRGPGDHWIAGGALAISALAASELHLHTLDVVLAVAALAWLPVLAAGELLAPRAGDPAARWSTVFPVGMYAAMAYAAGFGGFARVWTWVALAVWAAAAAYSLMRGRSGR